MYHMYNIGLHAIYLRIVFRVIAVHYLYVEENYSSLPLRSVYGAILLISSLIFVCCNFCCFRFTHNNSLVTHRMCPEVVRQSQHSRLDTYKDNGLRINDISRRYILERVNVPLVFLLWYYYMLYFRYSRKGYTVIIGTHHLEGNQYVYRVCATLKNNNSKFGQLFSELIFY